MKRKQPSPFDGDGGQLMAIAAHRYCLGRRTYIVSSCAEWLKAWWPKFEASTRIVIVRDTMEALQDGNAGDDCDIRVWREFARWAFARLEIPHRNWCIDAVAHRNKPWPL